MLDSALSNAHVEQVNNTHVFGMLDTSPFRNRSEHTMTGDSGRIEWAPSLKDGILQAQREGKPLVCVFEEDNCPWCKRFDDELNKPAATQIGSDAVFVRLVPSRDAGANALASNLGVDAYPTVSVLDLSGSHINERTRMTGYMTADQFAGQYRHSSNNTAMV